MAQFGHGLLKRGGLICPVKGARQNHRLRSQPQVFSQHVLARQQPFAHPGNAAKAKAQAVLPGCSCHAVHMAQHQWLKHETAAQ